MSRYHIDTTEKYKDFQARYEHGTEGLDAFSTGACCGCDVCNPPPSDIWQDFLREIRKGHGTWMSDADIAALYVIDEDDDEDCHGIVARLDNGDHIIAYCVIVRNATVGWLAVTLEWSGSVDVCFSWQCDVCGSTIGGLREPAHYLSNDGKRTIEHLDVCTDCQYFAEYGTLDDMTMISLKEEE